MNSPEYQREQDRINAGEPTVDTNDPANTELFKNAPRHPITLRVRLWFAAYACAQILDGMLCLSTLTLWRPQLSGTVRYLFAVAPHQIPDDIL